MAAVSELKMSVLKTINLGNFENIKIEVGAAVNRTDDNESSGSLRNLLLDEVALLLSEAEAEYVPKRRVRSRED